MRKEDFTRAMVEKQLELGGWKATYDDINKTPDWYSIYHITTAKHLEFKDFFIKQAVKTFKYSKKSAAAAFSFWDLSYGLRILD
jgi:hypothetical protein